MTVPSISVENLSKRYRLGARDNSYRTVRDLLSFSPKRKEATRELWALRDVNTTIADGEAVGLIGHNGAGKSTLLKILSRITEPTDGRVLLHGRVASLLEVGTGFHPELTGRENVYLNGAILGMTRAEIRRDFDAIVAFADIERFLDTPVKHYSSGMYVRLAFAVAAHLTPEILLVDEVLAVGDLEFQRRCLGRMGEVARSGRTVVFVSHNLASIEALCPRSILMRGGQIAEDGQTSRVIGKYTAHRGGESMFDLRAFTDRQGSGAARITAVELLDGQGSQIDAIEFREPIRLRLHYESSATLPGCAFGFALLSDRNERVVLSETTDVGKTFDVAPGTGAVECLLRAPNLLPGIYRFEFWISSVPGYEYADHLRMIGAMEITANLVEGLNVAAITAGPVRGHVYMDSLWSKP
jgi:lipopolysaccharide transport system ATP-binding protein